MKYPNILVSWVDIGDSGTTCIFMLVLENGNCRARHVARSGGLQKYIQDEDRAFHRATFSREGHFAAHLVEIIRQLSKRFNLIDLDIAHQLVPEGLTRGHENESLSTWVGNGILSNTPLSKSIAASSTEAQQYTKYCAYIQ